MITTCSRTTISSRRKSLHTYGRCREEVVEATSTSEGLDSDPTLGDWVWDTLNWKVMMMIYYVCYWSWVSVSIECPSHFIANYVTSDRPDSSACHYKATGIIVPPNTFNSHSPLGPVWRSPSQMQGEQVWHWAGDYSKCITRMFLSKMS